MSLADTLKERTADMHRHAETRLLQKALVSGKVTRDQLSVYLAQLGHLHQAIELLLESCPHEAVDGIAACTRDHSEAIARDIEHLEGVAVALPETERLVEQLHEQAQSQPLFVVGALYVLEGSMNGNRFIARGLAGPLGLAPGKPGLAYWDPYGEDQRPRWAAFRAALDNLALTDAEQAAVADGAEFMFAAVAEVSDAAARASQLLPAK